MQVAKAVLKSIVEWEAGDYESAMLFACIAVDGTARLHTANKRGSNRERFTRFLRDNYDIMTPMAFNGVDLNNSVFYYFDTDMDREYLVDIADFIYLVHRNSHAHGAELRPGFGLQPEAAASPRGTSFSFRAGATAISDRTIFALLACVVLADVNAHLRISHQEFEPFLTWDDHQFLIDDWWGRKADFVRTVQPIFEPGIAINFAALARRN